MLSLKAEVVDEKIRFSIFVGEDKRQPPFLQFIWPVMGLVELRKFIGGMDVEDQNDEGVWVKMKDKVLNIQLHRGENDDEIIEINLPHSLIADEKVFGVMLDAYEAYWEGQNLDDDGEPLGCDECGRCAECRNLVLCDDHKPDCNNVDGTCIPCSEQCRCGEEELVCGGCKNPLEACACFHTKIPNENDTGCVVCEGMAHDCGACSLSNETQSTADCSHTGVCETKAKCRDNCKWC